MLKRSDLAMYRVRERRADVKEYIESYEAERWNGFLGGIKGVTTFATAAVVFSVGLLCIGMLFHIEALVALYYMWGITTALIFSQCVRNYKNAEVDERVEMLKKEYVQLTKMSREVYFA